MDRRQALVVMGQGLCSVVAGGVLTGCRGGAPATTRVDLDAIPDPGRLVVDHRGTPVELRRSGSTVEARSLWCTHFGCEVQWDSGRGEYLCPCHDGRFDAHGRPIAGPPTIALRSIPVALTDNTISIGSG